MSKERRTTVEEQPVDAGTAQGDPATQELEDTPEGETTPTREELVLLLEDARSKADEHWDAVLRTRAELENLRKRSARDVENAHKYGLDRMVSELLPVCDSMELGLSAAEDSTVDVAKVREGLELTVKMMQNVLEKIGVEEIDPQGEKFDPERHQAMTMQETSKVEPGTVVSVIQKGYLLNDRLVRPALVVVARERTTSS